MEQHCIWPQWFLTKGHEEQEEDWNQINFHHFSNLSVCLTSNSLRREIADWCDLWWIATFSLQLFLWGFNHQISSSPVVQGANLTQCVVGPCKCTCHVACKSVEWFKPCGRMWWTDDRQQPKNFVIFFIERACICVVCLLLQLRITVWSLVNKTVSYIKYPKQCPQG